MPVTIFNRKRRAHSSYSVVWVFLFAFPTGLYSVAVSAGDLTVSESPSYNGAFNIGIPADAWAPFQPYGGGEGTIEEQYTHFVTGVGEQRTYPVTDGTYTRSFSGKSAGHYRYVFRACGQTAPTNGGCTANISVALDVFAGPAEPPGMPAFQPSVLSCDTAFKLSWQSSPDADSYQVREKRRVVGQSWPVAWSPLQLQASTIFWPSNLTGATEYIYQVRAVREMTSGAGDYSDWVQSGSIVRPAFEPVAQPRADFQWRDYTIYYGDFDGDGDAADIYLWGADKFVLIHADVSIPLIVNGPASFKLLRRHDGSYFQVATDSLCLGKRVRDPAGEELQYRASIGDIKEIKSGSDFAKGDFNGDGYEEIVLISRNKGDESAIITWTSSGQPAVIGTLALADYWDQFSVSIADVNDDGREDIKIYSNGSFVRVLIANEQGKFSIDSDDSKTKAAEIEQTIRLIWQEFSSAIASGDIEAASQYTLGTYAEKLAATAAVLGSELAEVLGQVEEIEPYYMSNELAIFLLRKQADNGQMYLHTMTLVPQHDGSWRIKEL